MPAGVELNPHLLALMERQDGVFTTEQARSFGHTLDELQRLRTRGRRPLKSVRRGVYAWREQYGAAGPADRHRLEIAAAYLRLGSDVVLTHQSAAIEHGLALLDADLSDVHVTRSSPCRPHVEAGIKHHVAALPRAQVVERENAFDLSSLARTAVDVARDTARLECAVAACDSALRMGVPRDELREVFWMCRTWPGARFVATAIDLADGRAHNPGESFSRVVLTRLGLAPDGLQVPMSDSQGLIGFADFGWEGVYGEFDGKLKYGLGDPAEDLEAVKRTLLREKLREDRMRAQAEVVRWGMAELYRPKILAGRVRAAMARAADRGLRAC